MLKNIRARAVDQRFAVSAVYVAVLFINIMDVTIVNVTLPTLGRDFHVAPTAVDVVSIGYLVSLAVFIPASGWIGDRFGGKRTLLVAVAIFTIASALCGLSTSLGELVVFRVLQGVGGGMLTPVGLAMMYRIFPQAERVRLASLIMIPTALAPALGPVLGGLLVTDLSWRWVFYVNLPVGIAAVIFGMLFLEEQREADPGRFDAWGFALAGVGLGALMYGVSEGPDRGWGTPVVWGTTAAGAALLVTMVIVERRTAEPMVHLRLFRDRMFRASNVMVVMAMTGFFGVLYAVPLYYQDARGLSALASGLSTFPEAIGVMLGAQVASRLLYPRLGPRRLMAGGLCGVAVAIALMSLSGAHTNLWWMRLLMFGLGLSIPNAMVSMQTAAFATISPASTGQASTLFNANRQLGGAIGVAVLSSVISAVGAVRYSKGRAVPFVGAYHWAFLTAAALAVVSAALALVTIHDEDAASTLPARRAQLADAGANEAGEAVVMVPVD